MQSHISNQGITMLTFSQNFATQDKKAQRDVLFSQILKEREYKASGYYELPFQKRALQDSKEYLSTHKELLKNLKNLVIIGIGGSSLGLRAIDSLLSHTKNRKNIALHFLEHTDSIPTNATLKKIKLKNTLFVAISKSGTTIETSSLMKYVLERFKILENKESKKHLLIITDENSPLQQWAHKEHIATVCIDKNVGGRFSVLSAIGILPLKILGYDTKALLKGAREFAEGFFARKEEHLLQKALFLAQNHKHYSINVLFSYASVFKDFNAWYVQLWGESLGKIAQNGVSIGLTPVGLVGSIDQHSFLQLIVQGVKDKSVTFLALNPKLFAKPTIPNFKLEFLESTNFVNTMSFAQLLYKQQQATMQTLQTQNIPTDFIRLDSLAEPSIGALIMYYELLTSAVGCLLKINTYDQPGVEFGKKRLFEDITKKAKA